MESLDMLANNLANASTAGYKVDREFYSLYMDAEAHSAGVAGESPRAIQQPLIDRPWTDLSQATLQPTGGSLDLAISGRGFFAVESPSGVLHTRNGAFQLSRTGEVVTEDGYKLRLEDGTPLRLDPRLPIEISRDGSVQQDGQQRGRLQVTEFASAGDIAKAGSSYFRAREGSGIASTASEVHQGKLESSNVAPAESAVRLVGVMRQFEMLQRAITLGGEMSRRAIEEVAKPT
jgi:flagellar basal body rod protein FlgG